jgi:hypothetical protein
MAILPELLSTLKERCASFPDKRKGAAAAYTMADIGLAGFSLFFMQSESFLEYQRMLEDGHGRSNCQSLFGMRAIPSDNHIRSMLDAVEPCRLEPCFAACLEALQRHGAMGAFQRLGGRCLIALDGTEYFCSHKLGCRHCLTRKRANGATEHYHALLAASLVAPGHSRVLPLSPEFIAPQDGADKQDCERSAAQRWLLAHAPKMKHLRPVYLADDLFACQPICQAVKAQDADFLFTCKPESHKALYDFIAGAEPDQLVVHEKLRNKRQNVHYRWFTAVPLRDGKDAIEVNHLSLTIRDAKGKVTYHNAFITSLPIDTHSVAEIAACARARWKIENGSFNVMKNNGYGLEHNFGHGKDNLAMLFAAMNLLAFAFHTVCDLTDRLWITARLAKTKRQRFFEHLRTVTAYLVFPDWQSLLQTLITSHPPQSLTAKTHNQT